MTPEDRLDEAAKQVRLAREEGRLNEPARRGLAEIEVELNGTRVMLEADRKNIEPEEVDG